MGVAVAAAVACAGRGLEVPPPPTNTSRGRANVSGANAIRTGVMSAVAIGCGRTLGRGTAATNADADDGRGEAAFGAASPAGGVLLLQRLLLRRRRGASSQLQPAAARLPRPLQSLLSLRADSAPRQRVLGTVVVGRGKECSAARRGRSSVNALERSSGNARARARLAGRPRPRSSHLTFYW